MSMEGSRKDVCMNLFLHKSRDMSLSLLRNTGLKGSLFEQPNLVKKMPLLDTCFRGIALDDF